MSKAADFTKLLSCCPFELIIIRQAIMKCAQLKCTQMWGVVSLHLQILIAFKSQHKCPCQT